MYRSSWTWISRLAGVAALAQLFGVRRAVAGVGPAAAEAFLVAALAVVVGAVIAGVTARHYTPRS
jgi:hypothetical protein